MAGRRRLLVALFVVLGSPAYAQSLQVQFLDVGQGAAVLLREGSKSVLVDAGSNGAVAEHLRSLGIDTVDLVVASHNHADHIGGMPAVFASTFVRYYMDNGLHHNTATYGRTVSAVQQGGATYLRAESRRITLTDAQLRIIPPPPTARTQNEASVGVLIEYGGFRALLTGDSEVNELEHWLQHDSIPQVHVLKVAHHGADDGTTAAWANATRPSLAVISVGGNNAYGHPTNAVMQTWAAVGASIYRTDLHGTIVIEAKRDGTFTVSTANAER